MPEIATDVSAGAAVTVTANVDVAVDELVVAVAAIVADPAPTAVTSPSVDTVATLAAEVLQVTVAFTTFPAASRGAALSWRVWPATRLPETPGGGVTDTVETLVLGSVPVAVGASDPAEQEATSTTPAPRQPPSRFAETKLMS